MGATKDGKIQALKVRTIADHGYTDAAADPSKFPAGLFNVITGSYDFPNAFVEVDGVYTNKPPGGVAYRCSFRVTEAVHAIERMVDILAHDIGKDPAQLRMENFIQPEQFPYHTPTGWDYDSGDYPAALQKALDIIGYDDLRKEQAEKRARGELMGIGISSFTEIVGAGPSHSFDILGLKMFDSCEIRVHPTGKVLARLGVQSQGQGHETTFAQIIAEELGFPVADIKIEEGDTDTAPYGLGTYASRSTPVAGAATAIAARKIKEKARLLAAHLLEASPDDLEWTNGKWSVKGSPDRFKTIQEIAFAAYTNHPAGMEAGPRGGRLLRPAQPDVPVRLVHRRRGHRQGDGRGQGPPVRRGRRLRQHHQPDDRGRADPRRPDDGPGPGAVRGDHLRRAGQQPRRDVHGLPAADGGRDPRLGGRARPSPRRRTTRSAPRASASRRRSARRRRSRTRSSTRCGTSASATSTSRSRRPRSGRSCTTRASPRPMSGRIPFRRVGGAGRRRGPRSRRRRSSRSSGPRPPARRAGDHPPGRDDRGLGRRQLRPARRRPRGAPVAPGRPAPAAPAVEGRPRRGPPRRRDRRAGHDLPLGGHAGDLRGTASARAGAVGRRDHAHRRPRSPRWGPPPAGASPCSTRWPRPTRSRAPSSCSQETGLRRFDPEPTPYVDRRDPGDLGRGGARPRPAARTASRTSGLVASPTRAAVVRAWLRDEGIPEERLAALRAPAGIDLGAETPEEVAISILAELVQVRRGRASFVAMPGPGDAGRRRGRRRTATSLEPAVDDIVLVDPVCGMTVDRAHARHLAEHGGVVYAFCRMGCRTAFIKEPARLRPAVAGRRALTPSPATGGPMQFQGTVQIEAPARQGLGVPHRPQPGGLVRPGRRVDRGHRRGPLPGQGEGRASGSSRPGSRST